MEAAVLSVAGLGYVEVVSVAQELRRGGGGKTAGQSWAGRHQTGGVAVTPRGEHGA